MTWNHDQMINRSVMHPYDYPLVINLMAIDFFFDLHADELLVQLGRNFYPRDNGHQSNSVDKDCLLDDHADALQTQFLDMDCYLDLHADELLVQLG